MHYSYDGAYAPPGINDQVETYENNFLWDRMEKQTTFPVMIGGDTRDVGNTDYTQVLRPGLLLGRVTSTGKLKEWNPTGTDGSQLIFGILNISLGMTRIGNNQDRFIGDVVVKGHVKPDRLIIPGTSALSIVGSVYEHWIRAQLYQKGFLLTDASLGVAKPNPAGGWLDIVAKTANYVVTYADNNTLFTNRGASGAVVFTLPALPLKSLRYGFYVAANQDVTVNSAAVNQIVAFNDVDADGIAFTTSGEKAGTFIEFIGDGTQWLSMVHLPAETVTPTITT